MGEKVQWFIPERNSSKDLTLQAIQVPLALYVNKQTLTQALNIESLLSIPAAGVSSKN